IVKSINTSALTDEKQVSGSSKIGACNAVLGITSDNFFPLFFRSIQLTNSKLDSFSIIFIASVPIFPLGPANTILIAIIISPLFSSFFVQRSLSLVVILVIDVWNASDKFKSSEFVIQA